MAVHKPKPPKPPKKETDPEREASLAHTKKMQLRAYRLLAEDRMVVVYRDDGEVRY